jgi:methyl-accepting chemotaxis protein
MKNRSLRFKMIMGGVMAVLVPLLVVGGFAIYKAMSALEDVSKSQAMEMAKGLAHTADVALQEELKIAAQLAVRDVVIAAAAKRGQAESEKATTELTAMVQQSGNAYETIVIAGTDGKVFADGQGGKNKNLDLFARDYIQAAMGGNVNVGSVTKSKATGNTVLTFGAPIYSRSKEIIGIVGLIVNISFLTDKVAATKLGKTGYGYGIDKTGLVIAHPNKDYILSLNLAETEGMKKFIPRMIAGESGSDPYIFKGVKKVAGFAPVPLAGWSICMTQDYSEFMAPAYHLMWIVLIIGLIFMIVTAVAVFFLAKSIALPIGDIAKDLNDASAQVAAASSQIASASQSLAEGSSEQASALEETSSSLEEMSSMTKQNADNAAQAKAFMAEARQIVDKLDGQMNNMVASIQEVTKSSEETGKIIKTIDEIAFQTNLLALNAAVEAARAGEAGAGFAVVADEVRNLAMRAAEAAKHTASLIENTIMTVRKSRDLTQHTQEDFKENMEISSKVGQLVDEIAAASHEQAQGIGQIGKAVAEMDKVVQQTAASAEETASASEQMNAQVVQMKSYVDKLVSVIDGSHDQQSSPNTKILPKLLKGGEEKHALQSHGGVNGKKLLTGGHDVAKKEKLVRPRHASSLEKANFKDF